MIGFIIGIWICTIYACVSVHVGRKRVEKMLKDMEKDIVVAKKELERVREEYSVNKR